MKKEHKDKEDLIFFGIYMNKYLKEVLSYVLIIIVVLLIKKYIFSPIKVNGDSMFPTLHDNDIMILNEIGYHINGVKRFDIVVVDTNNDKIIKRIIGLPGETVTYKDNKLYINGEYIEENFEHDITHNFELSKIEEEIIPEDYYFVVGDNRGKSLDSRTIGLIHKDQILGKTNFIVFPFSRFGNVNE